MKIAVAQMQSFAGEISKNIEKHLSLVQEAVAKNARVIFFSELSITGYEPKLAKELASTKDDQRFDTVQNISNSKKITICIGMPIRANSGIEIGMIIFEPGKPRRTYSKQLLHEDELPYFVAGRENVIIQVDQYKIAPAICFESLQIQHAEKALEESANVYVASVAKSARAVEKAFIHYREVSKRFSIPVLMANNVGPSDDFVGQGQSSVWTDDGKLISQLGETNEGILVLDLQRRTAEMSLI